jgi:hypothetical protein
MTIMILAVLVLTGCNPFLPIYQRTDINGVQDEDGISLIIDGVRYKMFPETKWDIEPIGTPIGYAGSWKTTVYQYTRDPERNFVFLHDFGTDKTSIPLYRTDKDIPEPSAESIDKLVWSDYIIGWDGEGYTNVFEDKEIIKELFDALNTGKKVGVIRPLNTSIIMDSEDHSLDIYCYSSELPFASYDLHFGMHDGKIICSDFDELFVEVPKELLEKIAEKSLDIDGYKP